MIIYKQDFKGVPKLPVDARIIHIAEQHGNLTVWYETKQDEIDEMEFSSFLYIVGTGQKFKESGKHVGTAIMSDGFVWHVYDKRK